MDIIHIIAGILSTWGITECYSHETILSIKTESGKQLELRKKRSKKETYILKLLSCTFCINHWISLFVSICITYFHGNIILTFLYWFIFSRCSNLLNDLTYEISRTPTSSKFVNL